MASTYDDNNCVKNGSTKHQWYFSVCQIMPLGEGNAARPASVYCTMGAHFQELQVVKINVEFPTTACLIVILWVWLVKPQNLF